MYNKYCLLVSREWERYLTLVMSKVNENTAEEEYDFRSWTDWSIRGIMRINLGEDSENQIVYLVTTVIFSVQDSIYLIALYALDRVSILCNQHYYT